MAKKEIKDTKKLLKKTAKSDISKKIEDALTEVKAELGEKKFRKRLKKASALFIDGLSIQKEKKEPLKKEKKKVKKEVTSEVAEPVA
ncbi:MAG: hypothetical protein QM764_16805 [Chitinophagaceae bacterium]